MRVRHPDPQTTAVDVRGTLVTLGEARTFDAPEAWVEQWCAANGYAVDDVRVAETCDEIKDDGEVCGRDRPCRYHDEA